MVIIDLFIESSAKFKILINCSNDKLLLAVLFFYCARKIDNVEFRKAFFPWKLAFCFYRFSAFLSSVRRALRWRGKRRKP